MEMMFKDLAQRKENTCIWGGRVWVGCEAEKNKGGQSTAREILLEVNS